MMEFSELGWFRRRLTVWKKDAPQQRSLPFDRLALRLYRWSLFIAPSWLFIDAAKRFHKREQSLKDYWCTVAAHENYAAIYGTVWLIILVAIWAVPPSDDSLAKVLAGVAIFRLTEIGNTILGFVLDQREPLLARSLITVAFQAVQIALIFAIVDYAFARHDFLTPEATQPGGNGVDAAASPFEYLYLSVSSMITLGNQYTPSTILAGWLEVGATAAGIILLGVVAARAIGLTGNETRRG